MNLQSACCADEYCSLGTNSDDGQPKCGTPANTHFPLIDGLLIASFVLLQSNVTKTVIRVNVKISRDALSWQTAPCNATMQASLETPRALWLMVTPADVSAVTACLFLTTICAFVWQRLPPSRPARRCGTCSMAAPRTCAVHSARPIPRKVGRLVFRLLRMSFTWDRGQIHGRAVLNVWALSLLCQTVGF